MTALIWPYPPSVVTEVLRFRTDVRRARSGEFRDSLHDATQILTYTYSEPGSIQTVIEQHFKSNIAGDWLVPLWHDMTVLNSDLMYGSTQITVDLGDFRAGGQALIWHSNDVFEIININTYESNTITLPSGEFVSQDYEAGSLVAPVLESIAPFGLSRNIMINMTEFVIEFYITDPKDLAAANYSTHVGFDIVDDTPSILGSLPGGLSQQLDFIENGFGKFALVTRETYTRWRGMVQYTDYTNSARWLRRQFIYRCRGQDRPFFLPTFRGDFRFVASSNANDTTLPIRGSDVYDNSELIGRYVYAQNSAGQKGIRDITAAVGTDTVIITVSSGFPFATDVNSEIELAHLVRFDTDIFVFEHARTATGWITTTSAPVLEVVE